MRLENQSPQSVRVIKLIDKSVAEAAPTVTAQAPAVANTGETITLSAQAEAGGVPAVAFHWDFGDGTSADSRKVSHAYTSAGSSRSASPWTEWTVYPPTRISPSR